MLKQMRENTKTILWIVVITFIISIFAVWGMDLRMGNRRSRGGRGDVVGSVDGMPVDRRLYSATWQELYNNLLAQRGQNYRLGDAEAYMLSQQAWETVTQKLLLEREIQRLGITVTDDELVSFLRRTPHPALRQMFTSEDGTFDYQGYLGALSDPQADWTELEKWGRQVLPEMKLEALLAAQVHVSEQEIRDRFIRENAVARARYVRVPFTTETPPYEPDDGEISRLYDETKDEFKEFEKRAIKVIAIEKTPSELDVQDVRERMAELRGEILGGLDFAEAAAQESDDRNSASKGGDLGFFGRGAMDSTFTEAAFALGPGELSEPVRTRFGYHLIRMDERTIEDGEERVHARHILMEIEPGYDTRDSLRTILTDLRDEINDKGFERGAERLGLEVIEPEPFARGSFIGGLGYLPRIVDFAFNNRVDDVSAPIESDEAIYLVKVAGVVPERVKPLDEVRQTLVERIRRQRREEAALERASVIRRDALTGGDLAAAALAAGLEA
ncbi:MAG: SurA N-terminal domain-containing protein, partial [Candidatus Krumholzibacteria bacterium]|nr:SurA N-terminal domain-containing protein [Candidatus Krumholzibacteria bacterium]